MRSASGELWLIVGMSVLLGVMVAGLVGYQRMLERRLATDRHVEVAIYSMGRTALALLGSLVPVVLVVSLVVTSFDVRPYAALVVLGFVSLGLLSIAVIVIAARPWRRIGCLRHDGGALELELHGVRHVLDLGRPFALYEGWTTGPNRMPVQVLMFEQREERWGFSYMLAAGKVPRGEPMAAVGPLIDGEARVVHERILGRLQG